MGTRFVGWFLAASVLSTSVAAADEIVVATTGGAFEKAMTENFFKPFEDVKIRGMK